MPRATQPSAIVSERSMASSWRWKWPSSSMIFSSSAMARDGCLSLDVDDAVVVLLPVALVGRLGGLQHRVAERVLVDDDDVVALLLELVDQAHLGGGDLAAGLVAGLFHYLGEDLLVGVGKLVPGLSRDDRQQRIDDVAGERDVL